MSPVCLSLGLSVSILSRFSLVMRLQAYTTMPGKSEHISEFPITVGHGGTLGRQGQGQSDGQGQGQADGFEF